VEDPNGYCLSDYWSFDDDRFDRNHDFIQWMFPLKEASQFNTNAPLLTDRDIEEFHKTPAMTSAMRVSFLRFLRSLGLRGSGETVVKAKNFDDYRPRCWGQFNHNWRRITRALSSMRLLGLRREAEAFFLCLTSLKDEGLVTPDTYKFWEISINGDQ
jgi:hypothetical protein